MQGQTCALRALSSKDDGECLAIPCFCFVEIALDYEQRQRLQERAKDKDKLTGQEWKK